MSSTTTTTSTDDIITSFYSPNSPSPDPHGRLLSTILSWPDYRLESSHNYIQTLFPLPEPSYVTPFAPLITLYTYRAFHSTTSTGAGLRSQLRLAFRRICAFYGFEVRYVTEEGDELPTGTSEDGAQVQVVLDESNEDNLHNWIRPFDHNHLRLTRIIRSLRVLGLEKEAEAFFEALREVVMEGVGRGIVNRRSLMFWTRAAERELYVPPDNDDGDEDGVEWLMNV